jgi:hypothetical protein
MSAGPQGHPSTFIRKRVLTWIDMMFRIFLFILCILSIDV